MSIANHATKTACRCSSATVNVNVYKMIPIAVTLIVQCANLRGSTYIGYIRIYTARR